MFIIGTLPEFHGSIQTMQQGICNSLRHGLNLFIVACALAIAAGTAAAYCQSIPVKPGRLPLRQRLASPRAAQAVPPRRPGGAATTAPALVAKAAPDGYTLLMAAAPFAI